MALHLVIVRTHDLIYVDIFQACLQLYISETSHMNLVYVSKIPEICLLYIIYPVNMN